jgi:hypothetical protein
MKDNTLLLSGLLLCALASLLVSTCGSPNARPDTLTIRIALLDPQKAIQTHTLSKAQQVQQFYQITLSLPPYQRPPLCTLNLGASYDLTFLEKGQSLLRVTYNSSGCGAVTFSQQDRRTPTQQFKGLFRQAITETTEPSRPSSSA